MCVQISWTWDQREKEGSADQAIWGPATLREDSKMFPLEHLEKTEIVYKGKHYLIFKRGFQKVSTNTP